MTKVSEEQRLKGVELRQREAQLRANIGELHIQKNNIDQEITKYFQEQAAFSAELREYMESIREVFGEVTVDLETGEVKEIGVD